MATDESNTRNETRRSAGVLFIAAFLVAAAVYTLFAFGLVGAFRAAPSNLRYGELGVVRVQATADGFRALVSAMTTDLEEELTVYTSPDGISWTSTTTDPLALEWPTATLTCVLAECALPNGASTHRLSTAPPPSARRPLDGAVSADGTTVVLALGNDATLVWNGSVWTTTAVGPVDAPTWWERNVILLTGSLVAAVLTLTLLVSLRRRSAAQVDARSDLDFRGRRATAAGKGHER